jgi:hypothetical protein
MYQPYYDGAYAGDPIGQVALRSVVVAVLFVYYLLVECIADRRPNLIV